MFDAYIKDIHIALGIFILLLYFSFIAKLQK